MYYSRCTLKARARSLAQSIKPSIYLAVVITLVVSWVLVTLSGRISGLNTIRNTLFHTQGADLSDALREFSLRPRPLGNLLSCLINVINSVWLVGFTSYCLRAVRSRPLALSNLLDGLSFFLRLFLLNLLTSIFTILWSLLFIIPGIIAGFRYSQAVYLLLDHPDWSPMRCIRESCLLMRGHKWQLFVLSLSFIGWVLLCAIPIVIIWVKPYMDLTFAGYYDYLTEQAPAYEP